MDLQTNNRANVNNSSISDLDGMYYYIQKVREINDNKFKQTGVKPTALCVTLGCQMNALDSEKLLGMLEKMGYDKTNNENEADLVIYNTCCVRENAENKVFGNLGYLKHQKKNRKDLKIVLCGCMTQQDIVLDKIKSSYRNVDVIFGTFNIYKFPELLYTNFETGKMVIDIWQEHKEIIEALPTNRESSFKSSVNIMYGCDNYCTYCIVPYVRGHERSREPNDILSEIRRLASDGVIEITLLGQNVNPYGKSLHKKTTFSELLTEVNKIDGIKRIRFMTSHPKDLSDDLIKTIAECKNVCKHIHLPIQSGSTSLLEKMNRKYTKEYYLSLIEKIREAIPHVSITTDIIVGFPGETDEDFEETLDVVKNVRFNSAFTFLYSKRTGTPAATYENHISEELAKARFQKLLNTLNPIINEINSQEVGNIHPLLVDGESEKEKGILSGRLDNNTIVHFKGQDEFIGKIINVKIIDNKTFYLIGEAVTKI